MESDDIDGDEADGAGRRSGRQGHGFLKPRRRAAIVVVALGVPSAVAVLASRLLTDFWWFAQVGHADVFWRILVLKTAILVVVGASAHPMVRRDHAHGAAASRPAWPVRLFVALALLAFAVDILLGKRQFLPAFVATLQRRTMPLTDDGGGR